MEDQENKSGDNENESSGLTDLKEPNIEELTEIVLNTREQGQMLESFIKNQIEVKDDMINRLHKELDYYKQDSADRFVDQLMKAVIKVRKDMLRLVTSENWESMSADDIRREYQYSLEDITDLLEQQNVDPYSSNPGDDFDPSIHQAKIEVTDDESQDKKIKASLSEGYRKGKKVLIPERVLVYQYKA
ncbi:nucleotide exchange factor GrpE [Oribacterium sp. FC2011]|uniref:nucleotide exchange factor GrpE n=1 Tax=Oribacterium sp. FC2011 TaxID=1408311 RepID=UPI0004E1C5BE|nr:nucleotide exchange factor GrpE [Oribacterium sp. FC2011]